MPLFVLLLSYKRDITASTTGVLIRNKAIIKGGTIIIDGGEINTTTRCIKQSSPHKNSYIAPAIDNFGLILSYECLLMVKTMQ